MLQFTSASSLTSVFICIYLGTVHFGIFIQGVCADGPGQSKITEMVAHNGYYACRICEFEGSYSAANNTCTYSWSLYERTCPSFRTRHRFESCLKDVERLQGDGYRNINVRGVKCISPLNHLIFIPTQAIYDYFHLCLEVSPLQSQWFTSRELKT